MYKAVLLLVAATRLAGQVPDQLTPHQVRVEAASYRGKQAVRLNSASDSLQTYALVKNATFHNGSIDVDLAGAPAAGTFAGARGFIGIAFRIQGDKFEYIYLRPTNGRADDQVRRNHSTQYAAQPDFDYAVLRRESPEKYESYVDLEAGAWTHYRITVQGTTARLFVNGAPQPCLIVSDLKLGDSTGGVALWVGPGTEGYFAGLSIRE